MVRLAVSASLIATTNEFYVRRSMSGSFFCALVLACEGMARVPLTRKVMARMPLLPRNVPYGPFSGYESLERVIACYDVTVLKEVTSMQKGT